MKTVVKQMVNEVFAKTLDKGKPIHVTVLKEALVEEFYKAAQENLHRAYTQGYDLGVKESHSPLPTKQEQQLMDVASYVEEQKKLAKNCYEY